jgi:hypothetical protein
MLKATVAGYAMKLTKVERERMTDSVLKVQSVRASLDQIERDKIPKLDKMEECLADVDHSLREALGYAAQKDSEKSIP